MLRHWVCNRVRHNTEKKTRLTGSQRRVLTKKLREMTNAIEGSITTKTITGESSIVPIYPKASVTSLKRFIEIFRGTPDEVQHLHFNGKRLHDA